MEEKTPYSSSTFSSKEIQPAKADPDTLHAVYAAFLGRLSLSDGHRDNLRKRGLKDDGIDSRGYRSYPFWGHEKLAAVLYEQFGEATRKVPGFIFEKEGQACVTLAGGEGMLIPVLDAQGRIVGMRIRPDDPGEGPKYYWLSSARHGGPGPGTPVHVPKMIATASRIVRVTEGELKADVAVSLGMLPTISVAGVQTWRELPPVIRAMGWETVRMAFDMDAIKKKGVAKALDECSADLIARGLDLELELWPEAHKGIDDALLARADLTVLQGQDARDAIARIFYQAHDNQGQAQIELGDAHEGPSIGVSHAHEEAEHDDLPDWKPFPIDALPLVLADHAVEFGEALAVHPAAMALFDLTTVAGCIGSSRVIRLTPTWTEPSIIFGNLICEPSTRKSAALDAATAPAEEWNMRRFQEHKQATREYTEELENFMAWAGSKNESTPSTGKPRRPQEPVRRRLIVKDITVETFIRELSNNPRGLFMPCDELRMWFSSFGKYSKSGAGSDECFWLSVFNGRKFDYDRKTGDRGSIHIDRLIASICGGVTPGCWRGLACQSMFDSGMIGRILLMWPPKVRYQAYTAPRESTSRLYEQLIKALINLDYDASLTEGFRPTEMMLTEEAAAIWHPWLVKWRHRQFECDGDTAAMLGKIEAYCARFALVFSVCDRVFGGLEDIVEACHVRNGIKLAEWFADEAERIYMHSDAEGANSDIVAVIQKVRERGERGITARELWHSNRRKWKTSQKAGTILQSLAPETGKGPLVCRHRRYYLVDKK